MRTTKKKSIRISIALCAALLALPLSSAFAIRWGNTDDSDLQRVFGFLRVCRDGAEIAAYRSYHYDTTGTLYPNIQYNTSSGVQTITTTLVTKKQSNVLSIDFDGDGDREGAYLIYDKKNILWSSLLSVGNLVTMTENVYGTIGKQPDPEPVVDCLLNPQLPGVVRGLSLIMPMSSLQPPQKILPDHDTFYYLESTPSHGELTLNGVSLAVGNRFTLEDVALGRLRYHNNGENLPTQDSFAYRVGGTTLVSRATSGLASDGLSDQPSVAGNCGRVAFRSLATNLVAGDTNAQSDIFLRKLSAGTTERVSLTSGGAQWVNQIAQRPMITLDRVAYDTTPAMFGSNNIHVRQLANATISATTYVTTNAASPDLDRRGGLIGFHRNQSGVFQAFTAFSPFFTNLSTLYSENNSSVAGNNDSTNFSIGGTNGNSWIGAFESQASNLVSTTNVFADIFLVGDGVLYSSPKLVSASSGGVEGNGASFSPSVAKISDRLAPGTYLTKIAFASNATNLIASDTNTSTDIFIKHVVNSNPQTMTIASVSSAGVQANADSLAPAMSANGRYVAFESVATNLVSADTNEKSDIFLRDVMSNTTTLVSIGRNGEPANGDSYGASISDDGRCVTFASKATNLVDDDTNGATTDVFVRWLGYSGEAKIQIINGHRNMLPLVLRM